MRAWAKSDLKPDQQTIILPGYNITEEDSEALLDVLPNSSTLNYLEYCGVFYTASAFALTFALERERNRDIQYLHIMTNSHGSTMTVLMRAFANSN